MDSIVDIFFASIKNGNREAVQDLLAEHPNLVQLRDTNGLSAVLTAIYHGQKAIAGLLVDRGAPLDLFEAAAVGRAERVQAILNRDPAQINDFSPDGYQALGLAAFFGHLELVEMLLEREADVNNPSRNNMRVQPINSAAAGGHLEIVRALLEAGADPNARQAEDFTPLHAAAQNGLSEMVRLLLDHGADPNALANGKTPADLAREAGHAELAEMLR